MSLRTRTPATISLPPSVPELLAQLRHLARRGLSTGDIGRAAVALELRDRFGLDSNEIARKLRLSVPAIERLLAAGAP